VVYKVFFSRLQRGVRYSARLAYLNINLRLLTLLAIAEARGYTTPGDARALYSRQRRGRKADRLLRSATATHYLKQENHPQLGQIYIPTPKATEALHTARTLLNTGGHPTIPTPTPHTNPKQTHPRNPPTSQLKPGAHPSTAAKPHSHGENKPARSHPNNQPLRDTGREKEKEKRERLKTSQPNQTRG